ncbi:MAG: hypothetical protein MHM6MM_000526 [Cercozoa sp. M6MM]
MPRSRLMQIRARAAQRRWNSNSAFATAFEMARDTLSKNGGDLSSVVAPEETADNFDCVRRGLRCQQGVKSGEELLKVPTSLLLDAHSVLKQSKLAAMTVNDLCSNLGLLHGDLDAAMREQLAPVAFAAWNVDLQRRVHTKKFAGATDLFWASYLPLMPSQAQVENLPFFWQPKKRQVLLPASALMHLCMVQHNFASSTMQTFAATVQRNAAGVADSVDSVMPNPLTWGRLLATWWSRTLTTEQAKVYVPFLDQLHPAYLEQDANVAVEWQDDHLVLKATRDLQVGDVLKLRNSASSLDNLLNTGECGGKGDKSGNSAELLALSDNALETEPFVTRLDTAAMELLRKWTSADAETVAKQTDAGENRDVSSEPLRELTVPTQSPENPMAHGVILPLRIAARVKGERILQRVHRGDLRRVLQYQHAASFNQATGELGSREAALHKTKEMLQQSMGNVAQILHLTESLLTRMEQQKDGENARQAERELRHMRHVRCLLREELAVYDCFLQLANMNGAEKDERLWGNWADEVAGATATE